MDFGDVCFWGGFSFCGFFEFNTAILWWKGFSVRFYTAVFQQNTFVLLRIWDFYVCAIFI